MLEKHTFTTLAELKAQLNTTLTGEKIILRPILASDFDELASIVVQFPEIYRFSNIAQTPEVFEQWFAQAISDQAFVVLDQASRQLIGSSRFYNFNALVPHACIGYTWYHPDAHGTWVNPEAKLLMLKLGFEQLNLVRIGFEVDSTNLRSRNAVLKLGAKHEGILRQHRYRYSDAQISDTYTYSILNNEWPEVKSKLKSRLRSIIPSNISSN